MVLIDLIGIPLPISYSSQQLLLVIYFCVCLSQVTEGAFDTQVSYDYSILGLGNLKDL